MRVTNVDEGRSWTTAAEKAARVTDFYSLASDQVDASIVPPLFAETQLSEIEAMGKYAIDDLLQNGLAYTKPSSRNNLSVFLGFQHIRGTGPRERSQAIAHESFLMQYDKISDEKLATLIKQSGERPTAQKVAATQKYIASIRDGSIQIEQPTAAAVSTSFLAALPVAESLAKRNWVIFKTPRPLLTCDEPVVPIGGPSTPRVWRAGVEDAWVVIFPMAPNTLLAMFKHPPQPHWVRDLTTVETGLLTSFRTAG